MSQVDPYRDFLNDGDKVLVEQAQDGNIGAMDTIFHHYHSRIYLYLAYLIGNDELAWELTQETFLKAWDAILELKDPKHLLGWLFCIAINLVFAYQKYTGNRSSFNSWNNGQQKKAEQQITSIQSKNSEERSILLKASLSQVTLLYRACLILQIVEKLTPKQVAQYLGITVRRANFYINRGSQEIRQLSTYNWEGFEKLAADILNLPAPIKQPPFSLDPSISYINKRAYIPHFTFSGSYTHAPKSQLAIPNLYICLISIILLLTIASSNAFSPSIKDTILTGSINNVPYKNVPLDPLFNAQGKRPSCMFNDNKTTYYRDMGAYICEHHLYQDVQQTFIIHGYSFTLEQAYLDANQLLISTRLIGSDGRGKYYDILAKDLKITIQGRNQNIFSSTDDSVFDEGRNTSIKITSSMFSSPISSEVFQNAQKISLMLQIDHLDIFQTPGRVLLSDKNQPIIFHLTMPFHAGYTQKTHQTIVLGEEHLTLENIVVTPSALSVRIKTPQSNPSFEFFMIKQVILSQSKYQLSGIGTETETSSEKIFEIYFRYAFLDKHGIWALTIPTLVEPRESLVFHFTL